VELPLEQVAALEILAGRLGYSGRTESLIEACVQNDPPVNLGQTRSVSAPLSKPEPPLSMTVTGSLSPASIEERAEEAAHSMALTRKLEARARKRRKCSAKKA